MKQFVRWLFLCRCDIKKYYDNNLHKTGECNIIKVSRLPIDERYI